MEHVINNNSIDNEILNNFGKKKHLQSTNNMARLPTISHLFNKQEEMNIKKLFLILS